MQAGAGRPKLCIMCFEYTVCPTSFWEESRGPETLVFIISIKIGGWGAELNREIVSCRACVRAVCMSSEFGAKMCGRSLSLFPFPAGGFPFPLERKRERERERERKREKERERERERERKREREQEREPLPPPPNLLSSFSWLYRCNICSVFQKEL